MQIPKWMVAIIAGMVAVVIVCGYVTAQQAAAHQSSPGFTQAWILPGSSDSTTVSVQIGIQNQEQMTMIYTVDIQENGVKNTPLSYIILVNNTTWTYTAHFPRTGSSINIIANIYRADQPNTVYRTVNLTING